MDPPNVSMAALVWLLLSCIIAVMLYLSYYFTGKVKKKKKPERKHQVDGTSQESQPRFVGGRRRVRMRIQRSEGDNEGADSDVLENEWEEDKTDKKIGTKKLRKLEAKAEKRAERQAILEEREERKRRELAFAAAKRKEDEQRQKQLDEEAEVERQQKEEQEKKDYEEYLKLKADFTIEESGEIGIMSEEESQSMLQEFINYVKASKVILLEDLAFHFNLKTQVIIDRLENLQEIRRLTGVMDDRGKFIYISEEELDNFARFIKQQGRISIADLAESSNKLIELQGEKHQIQTL